MVDCLVLSKTTLPHEHFPFPKVMKPQVRSVDISLRGAYLNSKQVLFEPYRPSHSVQLMIDMHVQVVLEFPPATSKSAKWFATGSQIDKQPTRTFIRLLRLWMVSHAAILSNLIVQS